MAKENSSCFSIISSDEFSVHEDYRPNNSKQKQAVKLSYVVEDHFGINKRLTEDFIESANIILFVRHF